MDRPEASHQSPPNSPIADDDKYVTMKKMRDLEFNVGELDSEYLMMQPSPVRLPKTFPGQLLEAERQFVFQPSVDESQLPDPIIPNQEMLRSVLYSLSTASTRLDVGGFDPLLCQSAVLDPSAEGSDYKPQPPPRRRKGHYARYSDDDLDTSSGATAHQTGQEWELPPTQPLRCTSQDSVTSPPSSERYLGHQPENSGLAQSSTQQQLPSPLLQDNIPTCGNPRGGYAEQFERLCQEFPDLNSWTCRVALEKHGGNLDLAREEVKVTQLMGMGFPYIDEDDCLQALSHCQGKMERAAMWLMEQSETIASRT